MSDAVIKTVSIICLVLLLVWLIYVVTSILKTSKKGRLKRLKQFRKGKFAVVYVIAMPLYFLAYFYLGKGAVSSALLSVKSAGELIVLNFNYDSLQPLMQTSGIFSATVWTSIILVILNALMFILTLSAQKLLNSVRCLKAFRFTCHSLVIVGYNAQNKDILNSVRGDRKISAVILANLTAEEEEEIISDGFCCVRFFLKDDISEKLRKKYKDIAAFADKKRLDVIVNTGDDKYDYILAGSLKIMAEKNGFFKSLQEAGNGFKSYVFYSPVNQTVFSEITEQSKGIVKCFDKHSLISFSFIEKYPFTAFMDGSIIDYKKAAIYKDVKLNTVILGFGNTGKQLFSDLSANDCFIEEDEDGTHLKQINYYVYDYKQVNDKNLNHTILRYGNELESDDYFFNKPSKQTEVFMRNTDLGSTEFYLNLKNDLRKSEKGKTLSRIIIALGDDLNNLDYAYKISEKLREWEADSGVYIFVRIKDRTLAKFVPKPESKNIMVFGTESDEIFNYYMISNVKAESMALDRHLCYAAEYAGGKDESAVKIQAFNEWYGGWRSVQRDSNIYACLNLRTKLNLIGYDYAEKSDPRSDMSESFLQAYQKGDEIKYITEENGQPLEINGKKIVDYTGEYANNCSLRTAFAVQEHDRWNAFMITRGFTPALKSDVEKMSLLTEPQRKKYKTELLIKRRHLNLTDFDGLKTYKEVMGGKEKYDVIKYDYQIMDDAVWLLSRNGYKIVKKEENNFANA